MSQYLYIDLNDGYGLRDYTKNLLDIGQALSHTKNEPQTFSFKLAPISEQAWVAPTRGAYVRFEDDRFQARESGIHDGVIFTGYITSDPSLTVLGLQAAGQRLWAYSCDCTSEEYLAQIKSLKPKVYISKTRGFILKDILQDMFGDTTPFPFDLSGIRDGGLEQLYQLDTQKKWADVAKDFGESDGYAYWVIDHHIYYAPEGSPTNAVADSAHCLVIDETDPRYTPSNLTLNRQAASIVNDITVIGLNEPTTLVQEHFISDGYQGYFPLAYEPYGLDETDLIDDDLTDDALDTSTWLVQNDNNYIQPFEGSLNIVGGTGGSARDTYVLSRKAIELSGLLRTRDGEIFFPPTPSGSAYFGGLYTSDDLSDDTNMLSGWLVDATAGKISPVVNGVAHTATQQTIVNTRSYVLRRVIYVDRTVRQYYEFPGPIEQGNVYGGGQLPPAQCLITYIVDEVNNDDVNNVFTTSTTLYTALLNTPPAFALYAPVVDINIHAVMNFVSVTQPAQIYVTYDGVPTTVGSYLDGGTCTVTTDTGQARLSFFATKTPTNFTPVNGAQPTGVITIPPQGTSVVVSYHRSDVAQARVQSSASITTERAKYNDDGIRQKTLHAKDMTPTPRTTEECIFYAQAYIEDNYLPRYEGTYAFETCENDETTLVYWPMAGDWVYCQVDLPDGTSINQNLIIGKVDSVFEGAGCYKITLSFGPVNRFAIVQRNLLLRRQSSLDDPTIADSDVEVVEIINANGNPQPADIPGVSVSAITSTHFTINLVQNSIPSDVVNYELRNADAGWGQNNSSLIAQFLAPSYTVDRSSRDMRLFLRPVNAQGNYSRRSAMVRVVYPLPNTAVVSGVTGDITADTVTINIPVPRDQDVAGILVTYVSSTPGAALDVLYKGDGITHLQQADGVDVVPGSGTVTLEINNSVLLLTLLNVSINTYNLLQELGTPQVFTIQHVETVIIGDPAPTPGTAGSWTWNGDPLPENWHVEVFDENGDPVDDFTLPGSSTSYNFGDPGGRQYSVSVTPSDTYGDQTSNTVVVDQSGDIGVPSSPLLTGNLVLDGDDATTGQTYQLRWTTPIDNSNGLTAFKLTYADNSGFTGATTDAIDPTLRAWQIHSPATALYFKIKATNSFGDGTYSSSVSLSTASPLDPLSAAGFWNYTTPSFSTILKIGTGNSFANVDDGTSKARLALNSSGYLQSHILTGVTQSDPLGNPRGMYLLSYNSMDNIDDGGTYAKITYGGRDGGNRAVIALNTHINLVTGIEYSGNTQDVSTMYGGISMANGGLEAYTDGGGGYRVRAASDSTDMYSVGNGWLYGKNVNTGFWIFNGLSISVSGFDYTTDFGPVANVYSHR